MCSIKKARSVLQQNKFYNIYQISDCESRLFDGEIHSFFDAERNDFVLTKFYKLQKKQQLLWKSIIQLYTIALLLHNGNILWTLT